MRYWILVCGIWKRGANPLCQSMTPIHQILTTILYLNSNLCWALKDFKANFLPNIQRFRLRNDLCRSLPKKVPPGEHWHDGGKTFSLGRRTCYQTPCHPHRRFLWIQNLCQSKKKNWNLAFFLMLGFRKNGDSHTCCT